VVAGYSGTILSNHREQWWSVQLQRNGTASRLNCKHIERPDLRHADSARNLWRYTERNEEQLHLIQGGHFHSRSAEPKPNAYGNIHSHANANGHCHIYSHAYPYRNPVSVSKSDSHTDSHSVW
jgi:hypothetical protein